VIEDTDELPSLPNSWAWTRLEEIGIVASGGTPSTSVPEYFEGDVPWITPADLSSFTSKFIQRGRRNISEKGLHSSSAVLLPAGTILFSSRAPIGYAAIAANPIATNQGFKNLVLCEGVFNEYVFHYLKASKKLAESYGSGTTFREVSASRFRLIPFPLAPYNEQRRIVVRLEELFACLDAGVAGLRRVKAQLKRYRQAVLKYAFEGKLTEEWRKTHQHETEPATRLLERVRQEKKKESKHKELPPIDMSSLPGLPENWTWARLGETVFLSNERYNPTLAENERFVGLEHIESGTGKLLGFGRSSETRSIKNRFRQGDLLYGRLRPYLNKVWVASFDGICSTDILVFQKNDHVCNGYLASCLLNQDYVEYARQHMSGVQHPRISYQVLSQYILTFPPFLEQQKIAEEIQRSFSITGEAEKTTEQSLRQAEVLRQSTSKVAFEGKLVPQDPNDEPAENLLERIKAERAKSKGENDTSRRKKNKPKQLELSSYVE